MIVDLEILAIKTYRLVSYPIYNMLDRANINVFQCRFNPSCSNYTEQAIKKYGPIRGPILGIERIIRCRPGIGKLEDPLK